MWHSINILADLTKNKKKDENNPFDLLWKNCLDMHLYNLFKR